MRAVIQRVSSASVSVHQTLISSINTGFLLLLGVGNNDGAQEFEKLADKIVNLRVFADENDKMNRSLLDIKGELLVVSQFTLYADVRKGRRPSFIHAASPEKARAIYDDFCTYLESFDIQVKKGVFGEGMDIHLCNMGPVTIFIDSERDL